MRKILEYSKVVFVWKKEGKCDQVNLPNRKRLRLIIDNYTGQLIEDDQNNIYFLEQSDFSCLYSYNLKSKSFKYLPILKYLKKDYKISIFGRSLEYSIKHFYLSKNKKQLIFILDSNFKTKGYLCSVSFNNFKDKKKLSSNIMGVHVIREKFSNNNTFYNSNKVIESFYSGQEIYYCDFVKYDKLLFPQLAEDWFLYIILSKSINNTNRIKYLIKPLAVFYNKANTQELKMSLDITAIFNKKVRFKAPLFSNSKDLELNFESGVLTYSNREIFLRNHEIKFLNHLRNKFKPGRTIFCCDLADHKKSLCIELRDWSLYIVYNECGECTLIAHLADNPKLELSFDAEITYLFNKKVGFKLNPTDIGNCKDLDEKQHKCLEYLCSKELEVDLESGILTHSEVEGIRYKMYFSSGFNDVDILIFK